MLPNIRYTGMCGSNEHNLGLNVSTDLNLVIVVLKQMRFAS